MSDTTFEDLRVIRIAEVKRITGLGRTTIYELAEKGQFPRPFKLGPRAVGWHAASVENWLRERIATSQSA